MSRKLIGMVAALSLATASMFSSTAAWAAPYSDIFVFGDSLSDSGNNAIVLDSVVPGFRTPVPLTTLEAPTVFFPYASDRYSNGPVWVEYLAANLGLSAQPSLAGGTNFAFGGAQSGPVGSSFPFSVSDQVGAFLLSSGGLAPGDALYVVEGGGNDAREFLPALLQGADPSSMIAAYASSMGSIITALALAGADHFLLWNVPDIGKIPLTTTLGAGPAAAAHDLAALMNQALMQVLAGLPPDIVDGIHLFDAFGVLGAVSTNPGAFGFTNAIDACALDVACIANPDGYFFWDGMHPTTAGHAAIAQLAQQLVLAEVPEPETLLLLAVGMFGLLATRRRAARAEAPGAV